MQNVTILGSTGSIGRQALEVLQMHPERFRLRGLCAHSREEEFLRQVEAFHPELAGFSKEIPVPAGAELLSGGYFCAGDLRLCGPGAPFGGPEKRKAHRYCQ